MRADTELFKDKIEVSLDGRQVFYLFFGGAVIASLVFVLGVMVGKRVEARSVRASMASASAADDPLAALDRLSQTKSGTRSFRSVLIEGGDDPRYLVDVALAAEPAAPAKAAEKPAKKAEATDKTAAKSEPVVANAAVKAPKSDKAVANTDKPAAPAKAKPVEDKPATAVAAVSKPTVPPAKQAAEPEVVVSGPPKFTLQLSSFRDRVEADAFFDKLAAAGYKPYIVEAEVPDKGLWYRVRLGGYPSYDAAMAAKKEFEASQRIIAYVTRISK